MTPAFYPATYWGGPITSTFSLCNALAKLSGMELDVLTTDAAGPRIFDRVAVTAFPMRYAAGYDVFFTKRIFGNEVAIAMPLKLWGMVRRADIVHLTGMYSFPTMPTLVACRLLGKPLVWSPRGALKATEAWKGARRRDLKRVWERSCRVLMPKRCVLHVTSEAERAASLARLPAIAARMIPNGAEIPPSLPSRQWRPNGALRLLYLGRIDPSKGIENLMQALRTVDERRVRLDICGAGDARYTKQLADLARGLGIADRTRFHGHVDAEARTRALLEADVCVLPSHSENFGMVVGEALAHGVPVIASHGTPWSELEQRGCGHWVDNSPDCLSRAITEIMNSDLEEMGKRGRQWMTQSFSWDKIASQMNDLYRSMV